MLPGLIPILGGGGVSFDPTLWYSVNALAGAPVTWSPTDKNANLTLSGGNLQVVGSGTQHKLIRATQPINPGAGKAYWELLVTGQGAGASGFLTYLGQMIGGTTVADGAYVTKDGQGCAQGYATDGTSSIVNGWTGTNANGIANNLYSFAHDAVSGKFWMGYGTNWFGTGTVVGDAFTGAIPLFTRTAAAAPMFPAASMEASPTIIANFGASPFSSSLASIVGPRADSFTKLLLHCEGQNGAIGFADASPSCNYMTATGSAQVSTVQSKFGSASMSIAGSGYVYGNPYRNVSDFTFGTGDFTIDLWIRLSTGGTGSNRMIVDFRGGAQGPYPALFYNGTQLLYYVNSAYVINGTTTIAVETWYHVAVTRSGTNTKMFLNGVQEGATFTDSTNYTVGNSARPFLGALGADGSLPWYGYFDEIRISKGIARWTANFTPPTAPYS